MKTHIIGVTPKRVGVNKLLNALDIYPTSKVAVEHGVWDIIDQTYSIEDIENFKKLIEEKKGRLVFIGSPGNPCWVDKSINTISLIRNGKLQGWAILSDYLRALGFTVTEDENRFILDVK